MIKMLATGCDMCSTFIISVNEWPDTDSKVSNAHDIWILLNALSNGGKKQIPNNKIWDKFIQNEITRNVEINKTYNYFADVFNINFTLTFGKQLVTACSKRKERKKSK